MNGSMQVYDFKNLPDGIEWRGAEDFDERKAGISPYRLPAWCRPQVPKMMDWVVRTPSGVRMRFQTNAHTIVIKALATTTMMPPQPRRPVVFDLIYGDQTQSVSSLAGNTIVLNRKDPTDVQLQRGEAHRWQFSDLGNEMKTCELWLPHNAVVELQQLELNEGAVLGTPEADSRPRWIHYGSSISHCSEANRPTETWPAAAASELKWNLQSLGFGGQCHLDPFIARTIAQSDAEIITIKVGINIINMDSMRERIFLPLLHGFIDTIREQKAESPIVLISPIYCPSAEEHPGPTIPNDDGQFRVVERTRKLSEGSLSLCRVRELLHGFVQDQGDSNLHYMNGLDLFSDADAGDLPDDLHPNPEGYLRMASRFSDLVKNSNDRLV